MSEPEHYRHHPRIALTSEVFVKLGGPGDGELLCRTRNLSLAGCFLETASELKDEIIELTFMERGGREAVRCRGEILRREPRGMAVRFLSVDWADLFGLARLIVPDMA